MPEKSEMLSENFTKKLRHVLLEADPDQGGDNTNEDRLSALENTTSLAGVRVINHNAIPSGHWFTFASAYNGYTVKFNPAPTVAGSFNNKINLLLMADGQSVTILLPVQVQLQYILKPIGATWCGPTTMSIGGKVTFYRYGGIIYV